MLVLPDIKDFQLEEILAVIAIPVGLTLAILIADDIVEPLKWRSRLLKTGWDCAVLALGVIALMMGALSLLFPTAWIIKYVTEVGQ